MSVTRPNRQSQSILSMKIVYRHFQMFYNIRLYNRTYKSFRLYDEQFLLIKIGLNANHQHIRVQLNSR